VLNRASIGFRLALVNALVLAAAMGAVGVLLYAVVDGALLRGADGILRDELSEVVAVVESGPLDIAGLREVLLEEIGSHASEALSFRATLPDGRTVAASHAAVWTALPPGTPPGTFRILGDPVRYRLAGRGAASPSLGPLRIEIAMRLRSADAALSHLLEVCLVLLPAALLAALAAGTFLARRALRPLDLMETAARRIGTGPPGDRLPLAGTGDELDRLAGTLNDMLGRIEEASTRNLRFAADVAHEVRTPLATIRARLESLRGGEARVEAAVREVERVESLVRSLLLICRADEREAGLDHAPLDLQAVAAEVAGFFAPVAAVRGIRFEVDVPPGLRAAGEPESLVRALANLVDNALHASDPGGEVSVRGAREGGRVRLEVLDRGCGVPEESRARIFERFFRAPGGKARNPGGSGLGLALVRAVARSHGGEASYEPRPGGGSVFRIELPPAPPAGSMPGLGPREEAPCRDAGRAR
jgi:signal transduction histidine kinase